VVLALEQEQQGVAAELQQHAVAFPGAVEHAAEDAAQRLDQFLAADAAAPRQLLGQGRETGNVRETQGAVDRLPQAIGLIERPLDGELGNVSAEAGHGLDVWLGMRAA